MSNILLPVLLERKVFISVETRRLVEQAFMSLVGEKREGIRQLKELLASKQSVPFPRVVDRYLIFIKLELAILCNNLLYVCEHVLEKDENHTEILYDHN
jgi:hypothetical protein